jgi:ATP adenylyltransferase
MESFRERHAPGFKKGDTFVRIATDGDDEKHLIVWRGPTMFVVMNLFPYNNGHLLIVPYRAVTHFEGLTAEERREMIDTVGMCIEWLRDAVAPEGFNIGMNIDGAAGAGIPEHLHMHVVPRWRGDTNFMSSLADTRVVPQAMRETYTRIVEAARRWKDTRPDRASDEGRSDTLR